jgi:hypothetical protein
MIAQKMRDILRVNKLSRDLVWVRDHLQIAIQLELSTLPPYLAAMWSVRRINTQVVGTLDEVIRAEMTHMGLVCNILNAVGGAPRIADCTIVPSYPDKLPGGVHIELEVPIQRLSKDAVANVFMKIEEPAAPMWVWHRGELWPTIGAFYLALYQAMKRLPDNAFKPERQITSDVITIPVAPIRNKCEALASIQTIRAQGEGTLGSPLFGDDPELDMAHYFRFGEILHEKRYVQDVESGAWGYTGDDVPFPGGETGVFPMGKVPPGGYHESYAFDLLYSDMLRDLQRAWLGAIARSLMATMKPDGSGETFGPSFRFIE